jgi:hypothetical protein
VSYRDWGSSLKRYERLKEPLATPAVFRKRVAANLLLVLALTVVSLAFGMGGYKLLGEHMTWYEAFSNACMILSGMGPLSDLKSNPGKVFEGFYALYSGLVLIVSASLILGPVAHRFLHKMHLADEDEG